VIVCHASDLHGHWHKLPKADLYIFTGDMMPNFLWYTIDEVDWHDYVRGGSCPVEGQANLSHVGRQGPPRPRGPILERRVDRGAEVQLQDEWLDLQVSQGGLRRWLASPDAQVVTVGGNHDFTAIGRAFGGDVWEVNHDPSRTFEFMGRTIGGCRGINHIQSEWNDELDDATWRDVAGRVPRDLDFLVTHAPPRNVLDLSGEHYGSDALAAYVITRIYGAEGGAKPLRAHFFGHIHEARGSKSVEGILFSNAATGHMVYEIEEA
jgi:Icc-related predicted phosphoesterase